MSTLAKLPPAVPLPPLPAGGKLLEPQVRGESQYDRVSSMLMAAVMGALIVAGWLKLIDMTTQGYRSRVTAPLEIVEVSGGGGGSPEGDPGAMQSIDVPGAEAGSEASNNEADASEFEAPSLEAAPAAMLDAAVDVGESMSEVDLAPSMPTGGAVASGRRSSKIGTGNVPGFGFGPGSGGVRREERWSIVYNPGQTVDEYARQLDALGVELATVAGPTTLTYGSNFSAARPTQRTGSNQTDKRLYFIWQGQGRKTSDIALLLKAGIAVGDKPIIQFYPASTEERLARLEVDYKGRQPAEILVTRFRVVGRGGSYDYEVFDQQTRK
jgi:hypothetical protein